MTEGLFVGGMLVVVAVLLLRDPDARLLLKRVMAPVVTQIRSVRPRRLTRLAWVLILLALIIVPGVSVLFGMAEYANAKMYENWKNQSDREVRFLNAQLIGAYNLSEIKIRAFVNKGYLNIVTPYLPDIDCIVVRNPKTFASYTERVWGYYTYQESFGGFSVLLNTSFKISVGQVLEISFICESRAFTWSVVVGTN